MCLWLCWQPEIEVINGLISRSFRTPLSLLTSWNNESVSTLTSIFPSSLCIKTHMSFSKSSKDYFVSGSGVLHAQCQTRCGEWKRSTLDLNTLFGNDDGRFSAGGENFSHTARDISCFSSKGSVYLKAEIQRKDYPWPWQVQKINLDLFIANEDGQLRV